MSSTARAYRAIDKFRNHGRNNNNKDHDRNKEAKNPSVKTEDKGSDIKAPDDKKKEVK